MDSLTLDAFLDGRLRLWQPGKGYRAGTDSVLLAASVPARPGQSVLDLGCGTGAVALCLGTRVRGLRMHGVEIQPLYAALARRNGTEAGMDFHVWDADVVKLPTELRQIQFDHVVANPPYFRADAHSPARDSGRAIALGESDGCQPLSAWIRTAARRLAPRGYLHVIQRTERLPELLAASAQWLGSIEILPLSAREGHPPKHVILRARKEGQTPFRLHAPLILRPLNLHCPDTEDSRPEIEAVFREAVAIPWPD